VTTDHQTIRGLTRGAPTALDPDSADWFSALSGSGRTRDAALSRLYHLLVGSAVRELRRRSAPGCLNR